MKTLQVKMLYKTGNQQGMYITKSVNNFVFPTNQVDFN